MLTDEFRNLCRHLDEQEQEQKRYLKKLDREKRQVQRASRRARMAQKKRRGW